MTFDPGAPGPYSGEPQYGQPYPGQVPYGQPPQQQMPPQQMPQYQQPPPGYPPQPQYQQQPLQYGSDPYAQQPSYAPQPPPGYGTPPPGYGPQPLPGQPPYPPYQPGPAAGGSGNKGLLIVGGIGLAVLVLIGAVVGGVLLLRPSGDDTASPGTDGSTSTSASAQAASAAPGGAGGTYKEVADICAAADTTSLKELYPNESDPKPNKNSAGSMTTMNCSTLLKSNDGKQAAVFHLWVDIFADPDSAKSFFEGSRLYNEKDAKVTDVPGVGQGAFSYVDTILGPHVAVYDGNMHMRLGFSDLDDVLKNAGDITVRLIKVAKATMAKLKA